MPLHELVYVSDANHDFTPAELAALLERARARNGELGVSGMLVYHRRQFIQLLEGEHDRVMALYERIRSDPRHAAARIVWQGEVDALSFAGWSMAFHAPEEDAVRREPGYSLFLESGVLRGAANPAAAGRHFLMSLREKVLRAG